MTESLRGHLFSNDDGDPGKSLFFFLVSFIPFFGKLEKSNKGKVI